MRASAELRHVSKSYGETKALDDVTLKFSRGETFTLLGPNGSGKTTLLKILACIEKPDSGVVLINGEKITSMNRDKARLAATLVFQKTTLFSTSVFKNIAYGLKLRGIPQKQVSKTVEKALATVKLEGYEDRPARKLSGGEQQRVSLARALALETPILLLDEPTANLDPKSASIVEEVIRQANRQRDTIVIIATHNAFQADRANGEAAFLANGEIIAVGTIDEILKQKPEIRAEFSRLENLFSGISEILEEGTSRITIDGEMAIECASRQAGSITVFIRPEDIILSKESFKSSARNVFKGRIVAISDQGSLVKLKVDAGKRFTAQITKRSFSEIGMKVGSQIYLTFKASSVQVA
jgi:molybdopterin-binding protein